jgi:DNA-binding transcriptional regulator LsrR (DeoR family)
MPKSRTASRQGAPAIPAEFDHDAMIWAAWLYYEEDLTQEAVAREIGISRASVNALLRSARQQGVVRIAIDNRYLQSVGEARRIRDRFGIETCLVVPAGDVPAGAPGTVPESGREAGAGFARLGQAGARLLAERLQPDDVLGVSWGRTVLAVSQALPPTILPGVSVVQVTGSAISMRLTSACETIPGACRCTQRPPIRLAMFDAQSSAEKR